MSWTRRKPVGEKRQCEEILETGAQCKAWATRATYDDEDGPRCRTHSMSAEQRSAMGRRMAAASATKRRGDVEAAPRLSGLDPGVTLAELLPVIREALVAKFEYTGEANWNVRLAAVGTILSAFPREMRRSPEDCSELIRRAIPPESRSPELEDARKVYAAMREAWDSVDSLRWSDLKGLWVAPYPAFMIAPFENAAKIQRSRPKPIPPERAPVKRTPAGPVLERVGKLPLVVPEEEPSDDWPETVETYDTGDVVAW